MNLIEIINLKPLSEESMRIEVAVVEIDPKEASNILFLLAKQLPLENYGLGHLKRARKLTDSTIKSRLQLILCPYERMNELSPELISKFPEIIRIFVSRFEPSTRAEFEKLGVMWPLHFKSTESERTRDKGFTNEELINIEMGFRSLQEDIFNMSAKLNETSTIDSNLLGAVIVNPENGKVILDLNIFL